MVQSARPVDDNVGETVVEARGTTCSETSDAQANANNRDALLRSKAAAHAPMEPLVEI
jgi:hypothetical protein